MRKNVRNMITAMALSAALCVVGGTAILVQGKASAEETSYVSVLEGASLRITGEFGFRFKTFIDKEDWSDNMEVHTLMIPTSELAAGEELVADSSNGYIKDYVLNNEKKYEQDGAYYFNTVLTNIPSEAYGTQITMRAYVVNGTETTYSTTSVTRSVVDVASAALADNFDGYQVALGSYVVSDITLDENVSLSEGKKWDLKAGIEYFDGTSETVATQLSDSYTLVFESSDESVATVDAKGVVTTIAPGTAKIIATINGVEGVSKEATVNVVEPNVAYGEVFDFDNIDMSAVSANSTKQGEITKATTSIGRDANGNYVEFVFENRSNSNIRFFGTDDSILKTFDWIKIKASGYYLTETGGVHKANVAMQVMHNSTNVTAGRQTLVADESLKEYIINRDTCANFDASISNPFRIYIENYGGKYTGTSTFRTQVVRIYAIEFGFNDIEADNGENSLFDLTNVFGVANTELTNVTFNGTEVTDVTKFKPTASGTLTFTVEKDGFSAGMFSVNVAYTYSPAYGQAFDFNNVDMSKVSVNATTQGTISGAVTTSTGTDENGSYLEVVSTGRSFFYFAFFGMDVDALKTFDWLKIKLSSHYLTETGDVYTGASVSNGGTSIIVGNGTGAGFKPNMGRQTFDHTKRLIENKINRDTCANFEAALANPMVIYMDNYGGKYAGTSTYRTHVVRIYSIEFGFNDIATDGTQAFNLANEFGVANTELSNVTFNGTPVVDATVFAPTESGTLTFTVKKQGYAATMFTINVKKS